MIARLVIALVVGVAVFVAAILSGSPAYADFLLSTPRGPYIFRGNLGDANPQIIHVPRNLSIEAQDSEKAWEDACVLGVRQDDFGVDHYVYRRVGCEYGRTNGKLK